jgi:ribosomal protein S18 acetylase RimI-like enzyme
MNLERINDPQPLNPVVRLGTAQVDFLAAVLGEACYNDPHFVYMIPDEHIRRRVSPWFFQSAIRAGQSYGEIYTTETTEGGALWLRPEHDLTFGRMVRTGMMAMPFKLEWGISRRCLKLGASIAEVRKRLAPSPHWYLMALGVETSSQENAIAGALLEPVLSQADSTGISCYLETFNERELGFYKSYGFRIVGAGKIPGGGPSFWTLSRAGSIRAKMPTG